MQGSTRWVARFWLNSMTTTIWSREWSFIAHCLVLHDTTVRLDPPDRMPTSTPYATWRLYLFELSAASAREPFKFTIILIMTPCHFNQQAVPQLFELCCTGSSVISKEGDKQTTLSEIHYLHLFTRFNPISQSLARKIRRNGTHDKCCEFYIFEQRSATDLIRQLFNKYWALIFH